MKFYAGISTFYLDAEFFFGNGTSESEFATL